MKFFEFLNKTGLGFTAFARRVGLSRNAVQNLYYKKSKSISLRVAMKIVEFSDGDMTIEDLYSEFNPTNKVGRKPKTKNPETPQEKT